MFIRKNLLRQSIRLYHDSKTSRNIPVVKFANSRTNRVIKTRKSYEANPKINDPNPYRQYEPFPYAITEDNKADEVKRVITPLHDIPYDEQLSSKESFCRNALRGLAQDLFKGGTPVRLDVKRLPCHVNSIVRAEQLTSYRNKDELSIWRGYDGKTITAGFIIFPIGRHGDTVCVEPNSCETMREEIKTLSDIIQVFLRSKAKLPVCFNLGEDSGWRRFNTRINADGEIMLIGIINPRGLRVQQVLDERDNFRDYLIEECSKKDLKLASLYYQPCPHQKCRHIDVPYELLHGAPKIYEKIGKYKFGMSPESFVHDNTKATETLYDTIIKTIEDCFTFRERNIKPLVIDARCGVGALSLNLAEIASRVVGVDSSDQSIEDAKENAKLNDLENVEFVCSNFEIVIERILDKYSKFKKETLVVCDTPRSGLHPNIIEILRHCHDVNRIVYITPNIHGMLIRANLLGLCSKSKANALPPFVPILATPVDTCPHTESFQTILVLERLPQ